MYVPAKLADRAKGVGAGEEQFVRDTSAVKLTELESKIVSSGVLSTQYEFGRTLNKSGRELVRPLSTAVAGGFKRQMDTLTSGMLAGLSRAVASTIVFGLCRGFAGENVRLAVNTTGVKLTGTWEPTMLE